MSGLVKVAEMDNAYYTVGIYSIDENAVSDATEIQGVILDNVKLFWEMKDDTLGWCRTYLKLTILQMPGVTSTIDGNEYSLFDLIAGGENQIGGYSLYAKVYNKSATDTIWLKLKLSDTKFKYTTVSDSIVYECYFYDGVADFDTLGLDDIFDDIGSWSKRQNWGEFNLLIIDYVLTAPAEIGLSATDWETGFSPSEIPIQIYPSGHSWKPFDELIICPISADDTFTSGVMDYFVSMSKTFNLVYFNNGLNRPAVSYWDDTATSLPTGFNVEELIAYNYQKVNAAFDVVFTDLANDINTQQPLGASNGNSGPWTKIQPVSFVKPNVTNTGPKAFTQIELHHTELISGDRVNMWWDDGGVGTPYPEIIDIDFGFTDSTTMAAQSLWFLQYRFQYNRPLFKYKLKMPTNHSAPINVGTTYEATFGTITQKIRPIKIERDLISFEELDTFVTVNTPIDPTP